MTLTDAMKTELKPGSKVMIYLDPITKTKPEGEATLVKQISSVRKYRMELWWVHFSDGLKVVRAICP